MNNIYEKLQWSDLVIVVAYVILLVIIGYRSSFRNRKKDETLFLAGHSLNWYNIGFNMWGTNVGPSSLLAFASIGYTTGIVAGNFEWYAFVFLLLLAMVFAPKYIASKVSTMPEYMGVRYGSSTQDILAWYALVKILVSWLSLGLFAGGFLVRQIFGIPMWQSVIVLVLFSGLFTFAGGLKTVAKVNVLQMLLLILVSLMLSWFGLERAGGITAFIGKVPDDYWHLIRPSTDPNYPWHALLLGYPVAAIAFFCTDQAMVQSVLGARNLEQGQLGVGFIGWLKVLALPLFILPGTLCYVLFPSLPDPNLAYMTMVSNLFPPGMVGLVIVVLISVLVATIGSSLNALSTVFTNDIYLKKINPAATTSRMITVGRMTVLAGCLFAVLMAIAIDNIKGLNLFDVFQSVLGFLAPSLSVVFLLTAFWKKTTRLAVNFTLSFGSLCSLFVGVLYLWVFTPDQYEFWPHYLLLSFWIFAALMTIAILISLFSGSKGSVQQQHIEDVPTTTQRVKKSFLLLGVVILLLYLIFNRLP
jgi:solute:Na+ symporter, SSS family